MSIIGPQGPQGIQEPKGEGFSIAKTYASVSEMYAAIDIDNLPVNSFVLINTDNVNDEDNAQLYMKTENGYSYLTDLSGAQGEKVILDYKVLKEIRVNRAPKVLMDIPHKKVLIILLKLIRNNLFQILLALYMRFSQPKKNFLTQ